MNKEVRKRSMILQFLLEGDAGDGQPLGDRRNSRDDDIDDSEGDKCF